MKKSSGARKGHGPTKRDAQKAQTHQRLMEAGRRLFAEFGFDQVSVTEIADAAGVSVGLINAHFGTKAGLLYEILARQNENQLAEMAQEIPQYGATRERILKKLEIEFSNDLADPGLCATLLSYSWVWPPETERENIRQRDDGAAIMIGILQDGVARGEIAEDADLPAAAEALYAIYLWGLRPAFYEDAAPTECLERILPQVEIVLRGIAGQTPPAN